MQQALFPCNYTGYDNNKGQVLASVYYHYILSSFTIHMGYICIIIVGENVQLIYDEIRMVEWIDDSRLKVTLSINRLNVRANVICEYVLHAGNVSDHNNRTKYALILIHS